MAGSRKGKNPSSAMQFSMENSLRLCEQWQDDAGYPYTEVRRTLLESEDHGIFGIMGFPQRSIGSIAMAEHGKTIFLVMLGMLIQDKGDYSASIAACDRLSHSLQIATW